MPDGHLLAALRVPADRRPDRSGIERHMPLGEGDVLSFHQARLELLGAMVLDPNANEN